MEVDLAKQVCSSFFCKECFPPELLRAGVPQRAGDSVAHRASLGSFGRQDQGKPPCKPI